MTRFRPLPLPVRALLFQHLAAMEKVGVPAERAYALLDLGPAARPAGTGFSEADRARYRAVRGRSASSGLFTVFEARLLRAAFSMQQPAA
ncbi:hypothetical protein LP420_36910 [Massilia sp. B-10]|nr:hypothetical protein LP420_36910 [Massilia sp. B-10]